MLGWARLDQVRFGQVRMGKVRLYGSEFCGQLLGTEMDLTLGAYCYLYGSMVRSLWLQPLATASSCSIILDHQIFAKSEKKIFLLKTANSLPLSVGCFFTNQGWYS